MSDKNKGGSRDSGKKQGSDSPLRKNDDRGRPLGGGGSRERYTEVGRTRPPPNPPKGS